VVINSSEEPFFKKLVTMNQTTQHHNPEDTKTDVWLHELNYIQTMGASGGGGAARKAV
jgi:hypothetical protein